MCYLLHYSRLELLFNKLITFAPLLHYVSLFVLDQTFVVLISYVDCFFDHVIERCV